MKGLIAVVAFAIFAIVITFSMIPKRFGIFGSEVDGDWLHFAAYALLSFIAVVLLTAFGSQIDWAVITAGLAVAILGVVLELIQIPLPVRTASISDLSLNFLGTGVGVLVAAAVCTLYRKRPRVYFTR